MKTFVNALRDRARRLRPRPEDGMETSEVVLILALVVIGVYGAWSLFKDKLAGAIEDTGDQISQDPG